MGDALLGYIISTMSLTSESSITDTVVNPTQAFVWTSTYNWILIPVIIVLAVFGLGGFIILRGGPGKLAAFKVFFGDVLGRRWNSKSLDKIIKTAGYSYDQEQDIFYSNIYPWQRNNGYCRLYDEAAAPLGMIIDCEPIYFDYKNKRWLIEFWKGQYDLCTGAEVGVYETDGPDLNIPGIFNGTFYHAASDEDHLQLAFTLKKNGKTLFKRKEKHWWLTGFKIGEYSEPEELTMKISITFKEKGMRNAFIEGLKKAGYAENEIFKNGNTVTLHFDKPKTEQPITRIKETDELIQKKNKLMCDTYNSTTKAYDNNKDKFKVLKKLAPDVFMELGNLGKSKKLFDNYEKIKDYLK